MSIQQVGGTHYGTKYGHWDYCKEANAGYLEGHATKYLVRWRKKGGIQDLEKSLTFVEKIMEGNEHTDCDRDVEQYNFLLERMFAENDVPALERLLIYEIFNWQTYNDLLKVHKQLRQYIESEKALEAMNQRMREHDDAANLAASYING